MRELVQRKDELVAARATPPYFLKACLPHSTALGLPKRPPPSRLGNAFTSDPKQNSQSSVSPHFTSFNEDLAACLAWSLSCPVQVRRTCPGHTSAAACPSRPAQPGAKHWDKWENV